ncbi:MAG: GTP 3',8-cyclase MoaA [Proteobacteria bacterium]|nr:GTP 3',8-cyclase MoaA [Desulfobacula sp.]MBU3950972.1 GTP 3',8-cyclase MoaA [Pseudomonadota bacterium]MBU4132252.1 GTP 3',8-cyclase MoaA [Pseudomonadota bacterium]
MIAGNRSINYLRISVTDRCNFRCRYCVPSTPFTVIAHEKIARYEEILRITRLACELGITKVRITGGEPFVRKGIFPFLENLCALEGLKDVSITTNGALLNRDKIQALIQMGIRRLNFSLDTLDPVKFERITGRDRFHQVWDSIVTAHSLGIFPIKINAVALRGFNDDEIETIAGLTLKYPFHIRFIEYMPMGDSDVEKKQQILTREIQEKIESALGPLTPMEKEDNDGPAKKFKLAKAKGVVGFITPISSHFCSECNRLRLTSRGTLRPCLLNNYEQDILNPLRNGASDRELQAIIESALTHKPLFHHLTDPKSKDIPISHMTSIGG